jgi:methylmalonyl-CoA mutase cobalamin-binding domain/chain
MSDSLIDSLVDLDRDAFLDKVNRDIQNGTNPLEILNGCREGLTLVGDRFQNGEYYLAELMLSASIFKSAMDILEPTLAKTNPSKARGNVVLATMKGDIHDLGKNILASLLKAHGFQVLDLGVDVDPEHLITVVKENRPEFVGLSVLITSAFESMKHTVDRLEQEGLRTGFKLLVGGGVTTPTIKEYLGADFQTNDAMAGVTYCQQVVKGAGV